MLNKLIAVIAAILLVFAIFIIIQSFDVQESTNESILYVGGGEEGSFNSIQDAINAANAGDTIYVYSGTYYENLVINKTLNLLGETREKTIINGNKSGNILYISADYVNISGFTITGSTDFWTAGVYILSDNNIIQFSTISQNKAPGIILDRSSNNIIENNILFENDLNHIWLVNSSDNNLILNNLINSSDDSIKGCNGIAIDSRSSDNIIQDNQIRNLLCIVSIGLWDVYNNTIKGNNISCSPSGFYSVGIQISNSSYNEVFYNEISLFDRTGISLHDSVFNQIFQNNLINNSRNAYDDGSNTWYNTTTEAGNYWSDYNGTDSDSDGIGDKSYEILPFGNNIDEYPLMTRYEASIDETSNEEPQVDEGLLYQMLIIAMVVSILFVLPVGYIWYRKHHKK